MELNAYSGGRRHLSQRPRKMDAIIVARCLGIEVTLVLAFLLQGKKFNYFIWIYVLLDTETTSVSLFYNIESKNNEMSMVEYQNEERILKQYL